MLWTRPVSDLVQLDVPQISDGEKERHRLYAALVAALVGYYWNGNKRGRDGTYPNWRASQVIDGRPPCPDYLGHNIAAIAVDRVGRIIDFDFNHNDLLQSSVEHAESRLIRRIFSLVSLADSWELGARRDAARGFAEALRDVTVYTSLESCAQCAGIMALGSVRQVVFLQRDPGQSSIGNILRNLAPKTARFSPPLPIPGNLVHLPLYDRLETAYAKFRAEVSGKPFFIGGDGKIDTSEAITSFLCTDLALDAFNEAGAIVRDESVTVEHADFRDADDALTNLEVLHKARGFYRYATTRGHRGTPHKL